jgi:predicted RNA-binding protein with RPS1 domain
MTLPLTHNIQQILKFGQEVDLDVIEGMSVNKTADELRAALKKLEARGERELAAWDQRLTQAAAELSRVTKANTEKLARVAELTRTQVMRVLAVAIERVVVVVVVVVSFFNV